MTAPSTLTRERQELLTDLLKQLPTLSGRARERTENAIAQLEAESAPGRGAASKAVQQ